MTDGGSLVRADGREDLEHLSSEARDEAVVVRALGDLLELEDGSLLVCAVTVMLVEDDRTAI